MSQYQSRCSWSPCRYVIVLAAAILFCSGNIAIAQQPKKERSKSVGAFGAGSLDIVSPHLGSGENVFGYGFRAGVTYSNLMLLITNHSTRGNLYGYPYEERRYDYALLGGYANRTESGLLLLGIGPSRIDYILRGKAIIPPSSDISTDGTWERRTGVGYGVGAAINYFWTNYYLAGGLGLYLCTSTTIHYVALEMNLIVFCIP
jgi:hypothetical protein